MPDLTLTFDNGPEPAVTGHVLDILQARGLAATFFVIGHKLAAPGARAVLRRAQDAGHWIGNHTWSHTTPLGTMAAGSAAEITRTQAALGPLAHPQRWFRPMGGGGHLDRRLLSAEAAATLVAGGYTCVLWNAVPRDWADPDGWVAPALAQVDAQDWTLLVLHDLPTGAMRHLPHFLDAVAARGVRVRQDFPPDCMPIRAGVAMPPLPRYVTPAGGRPG